MRGQDRADAPLGVGVSRDRRAGSLGDAHAATKRHDARVASLVGVLAGIAGGAVIYAAIKAHVASDFPQHIEMTIGLVERGRVRGEFLFFAVNALFAGFGTDRETLQLSLVFVLGAAIGAKVLLSIRFMAAERRSAAVWDPGPLPVWGAVAAALCAFATTVPVAGHRYLGLIPPTLWHNSTTIMLMPFAFGAFWTTLRFIETGASRWLWWSALLAALSLAAKPSYMLCLLPAFALLVPLRFRASPPARRAALLVAGIASLLALQGAYVFLADPNTARGAGVALVPLAVWRYFSSHILLSLLASVAFPLAALTLGGTAVRANLAVRYAILVMLAALAEYALLCERGPYRLAGDLTWQAIVAMWILFVVLVTALVPWYERRPIGPRQVAVAAAFLVQVVAGVLFLQHWFATGSYS